MIVYHFSSLASLVDRPTQPPASGAPPHPNTAALREDLARLPALWPRGVTHDLTWLCTFNSPPPSPCYHRYCPLGSRSSSQAAHGCDGGYTHENKTKYTVLCEKGHSPQPEMLLKTHHTKHDPKSMRVMPLCLWGV